MVIIRLLDRIGINKIIIFIIKKNIKNEIIPIADENYIKS